MKAQIFSILLASSAMALAHPEAAPAPAPTTPPQLRRDIDLSGVESFLNAATSEVGNGISAGASVYSSLFSEGQNVVSKASSAFQSAESVFSTATGEARSSASAALNSASSVLNSATAALGSVSAAAASATGGAAATVSPDPDSAAAPVRQLSSFFALVAAGVGAGAVAVAL